jgi:hypothetical protein
MYANAPALGCMEGRGQWWPTRFEP